jgi:hypothetical protein
MYQILQAKNRIKVGSFIRQELFCSQLPLVICFDLPLYEKVFDKGVKHFTERLEDATSYSCMFVGRKRDNGF